MTEEAANTGKWKLLIGIHNGTVASRDVAPTTEHDSLEECRVALDISTSTYQRFGYSIQFATATSPEGQSHPLRAEFPAMPGEIS